MKVCDDIIMLRDNCFSLYSLDSCDSWLTLLPKVGLADDSFVSQLAMRTEIDQEAKAISGGLEVVVDLCGARRSNRRRL